MRTLKRNKKPLYYANLLGKRPKIKTDSEGHILKTGEKEDYYSEPIAFKGSIALSGSGYVEMVEYGVNYSEYNAKLIMPSNSIPLREGSLIWSDTEPTVDESGGGIKQSADYVVVRVSPSLNIDKYILQRLNH